MNSAQIEKIELFAQEKMQQSLDLTHDWGHIQRVKENAFQIVELLQLKVDTKLVEACCLLHDVYYSQYPFTLPHSYFFESKISVEILKQAFDQELDFISSHDRAVILEAVRYHPLSFPFRRLNRQRSLYTQILQDADTIDNFFVDRLQQAKQDPVRSWLANFFKPVYNFGLSHLHYFLNFKSLSGWFGRVERIPPFVEEYGNSNQSTLVFISGYVATNDFF